MSIEYLRLSLAELFDVIMKVNVIVLTYSNNIFFILLVAHIRLDKPMYNDINDITLLK